MAKVVLCSKIRIDKNATGSECDSKTMLTVPHGAALSERNHATGRVLPAFYLYAVSVIYCMALTRGNFLQAALLSG